MDIQAISQPKKQLYTLELEIGQHFVLPAELTVTYKIELNTAFKNKTFTSLGINEKNLYGLIYSNILLKNGDILEYYIPVILEEDFSIVILLEEYLNTLDVRNIENIIIHTQKVIFTIKTPFPSIKPVKPVLIGNMNVTNSANNVTVTVPITMEILQTTYNIISLTSTTNTAYEKLKTGTYTITTNFTLIGQYYGLARVMFTVNGNITYLYLPVFFTLSSNLVIINYISDSIYLILPQDILLRETSEPQSKL